LRHATLSASQGQGRAPSRGTLGGSQGFFGCIAGGKAPAVEKRSVGASELFCCVSAQDGLGYFLRKTDWFLEHLSSLLQSLFHKLTSDENNVYDLCCCLSLGYLFPHLQQIQLWRRQG